MAVQACGDLVGRQRSIAIDQNFQTVSTAMQAVSARRLCGRKMKKFVEQHSTLIRYDLRQGLTSSLERCGPEFTWTAGESPVGNCLGASRNVAESCHDSSRQALLCGKKLPIVSSCENGDIKGRLQSHVGTKHTHGTTIAQETTRLLNRNNRQKNTLPTASTRELTRDILQVSRGGDNLHTRSASTTIEAIAILKDRQHQGIIVDSYTFVEVLKRCLKHRDLNAARQVHDCITQGRMDRNPYVANTLLNVYIKCGRLPDARRVFDGLEKKTVVTWSTMIAGYAQNDQAENALEVFNRMRQAGAQPGELMCLSILKACANPLALKWGKEVHGYIRHAGLQSDVRVGTALVQMYAKCGSITEASRVFQKLGTNRDVITWNVIIGAYADTGCGVEAYGLFLQMQREGFIPNAITYLSILNASASAGALEWVKEVHSHACKAGLESDLRVGNAIVHMYAKSGSIDEARLVFERLKRRDVITWNIMIGAYAECRVGVEAYGLFLQMQREGFIPNAITYLSILNASASAATLEWVKEMPAKQDLRRIYVWAMPLFTRMRNVAVLMTPDWFLTR